jgi:hypothetical protein
MLPHMTCVKDCPLVAIALKRIINFGLAGRQLPVGATGWDSVTLLLTPGTLNPLGEKDHSELWRYFLEKVGALSVCQDVGSMVHSLRKLSLQQLVPCIDSEICARVFNWSSKDDQSTEVKTISQYGVRLIWYCFCCIAVHA